MAADARNKITAADLKVVVAGGGNAAHVAAAMFSSRGASVNMYLSLPAEAEKISRGVQENGGITVNHAGGSYTGRPNVVSSDPAEVIPGADVIIIITPAFAHEPILNQIKPHLEPPRDGRRVCVGAIPAPGGFNWMAEHVLGPSIAGWVTIFGAGHLPWACRIEDWGKSVSLLGTKSHVEVSFQPRGTSGAGSRLIECLNGLFEGTSWTDGGDFLNCTLFPTNCIIHPGIMYGLWKEWDGMPVKDAPLFYQGLTDETAAMLEGLSDDIQNTKRALEAQVPNLDLSKTPPIYDYQVSVYGHSIADRSNLRTVFATNSAFRGLKCPMDAAPGGGLVPAFGCRYLTEDLPHGLAVLRGIAEIAGVETPHFDRVLEWAQRKASRVYLENGSIVGADVQGSGCPQRWGFSKPADLVRMPSTQAEDNFVLGSKHQPSQHGSNEASGGLGGVTLEP